MDSSIHLYTKIMRDKRSHNAIIFNRVNSICSILSTYGVSFALQDIKDHIFSKDPFVLPMDKDDWKNIKKLYIQCQNQRHVNNKKQAKRTILETYTLEEISSLINSDNHKLTYNRKNVKLRRASILQKIGFTCQRCFKKGSVWKLEKDRGNGLHLDLYSNDDTLMTIDHIVPKSKGGKNHISNYQCLCYPCNNYKGNTY